MRYGYVVVLLALCGEALFRIWLPANVVDTDHYRIFSKAPLERTEEMGEALELFLGTYEELFPLPREGNERGGRYLAKLYRDREEFRRSNRHVTWAEAFYRMPLMHAYYGEHDMNKTHSLFHEAVHQLNYERMGFRLRRWLSEGLATYFSGSRVSPEREYDPRLIDLEAYPVFWIYLLATSGDLDLDRANGSIIPLRNIVAGEGGPEMDEFFNLYYVHWWTLSYFLIHGEEGRYLEGFLKLVRSGGNLADFEELIGPVEEIELRWYGFVKELKAGIYDKTAPLYGGESSVHVDLHP